MSSFEMSSVYGRSLVSGTVSERLATVGVTGRH